jgi:hypothetical protein
MAGCVVATFVGQAHVGCDALLEECMRKHAEDNIWKEIYSGREKRYARGWHPTRTLVAMCLPSMLGNMLQLISITSSNKCYLGNPLRTFLCACSYPGNPPKTNVCVCLLWKPLGVWILTLETFVCVFTYETPWKCVWNIK